MEIQVLVGFIEQSTVANDLAVLAKGEPVLDCLGRAGSLRFESEERDHDSARAGEGKLPIQILCEERGTKLRCRQIGGRIAFGLVQRHPLMIRIDLQTELPPRTLRRYGRHMVDRSLCKTGRRYRDAIGFAFARAVRGNRSGRPRLRAAASDRKQGGTDPLLIQLFSGVSSALSVWTPAAFRRIACNPNIGWVEKTVSRPS